VIVRDCRSIVISSPSGLPDNAQDDSKSVGTRAVSPVNAWGETQVSKAKDALSRRELFKKSAALTLLAAIPAPLSKMFPASQTMTPNSSSVAEPLRLHAPSHGAIPVAFLLSDGVVVIDFAGPWEVFHDVRLATGPVFQLYTVAETRDPVRASGGLMIVPDFALESAPAPKVIVIPAQNGRSAAMIDWIRRSTKGADLTMSVCTGAFLLAETGLLAGKSVTTHHGGYKSLAVKYPDIHVKEGLRFVEEGNLASAGGLSSGIDLALHVVERYFGREAARKTAFDMEYQGEGWLKPQSNSIYVTTPTAATRQPLCPVCGMEVDPKLTSDYRQKTYYFCTQAHKIQFDSTPDKFIG
jgi:YHS domain-containing protein/putative intracellular protease/amidase